MSTLSRELEYEIPVRRTFSLVRDRGVEYSVSGHQKVRLLDQMKLATISEPFKNYLDIKMLLQRWSILMF